MMMTLMIWIKESFWYIFQKSGARGYYYEKHEIESKSKIEADETINFDVGGDYANVASEVIGGNVIIQAAGEVVVLSQKLYEEIHIWSKNHVNRMTITDYETAKITSTGGDNSAGRPSIVVYTGKGIYMEAPTIKALEGGLSITAEEKMLEKDNDIAIYADEELMDPIYKGFIQEYENKPKDEVFLQEDLRKHHGYTDEAYSKLDSNHC